MSSQTFFPSSSSSSPSTPQLQVQLTLFTLLSKLLTHKRLWTLALGSITLIALLRYAHPPSPSLFDSTSHPFTQTISHLFSSLSPPFSPFLLKHDISYRDSIEHLTSPSFISNRTSTLSFDHIYVLSLPSKLKRRARIQKIGRALDLSFTFVDALDKHSSSIRWIAQQVHHIRSRKRRLLSTLLRKPQDEVGGMKVGSDWLLRDGQNLTISLDSFAAPIDHSKAPQPPSLIIKLPSLNEPRWGDQNWVEYLHQNDLDPNSLDATNGPGFDVVQSLHDPMEAKEARQLNEGALSVWYGQTKVLRTMIKQGDESALVLEDDVDIEWDLARLWANVYRRLPKNPGKGWEIVYLGHCWGRENSRACSV